MSKHIKSHGFSAIEVLIVVVVIAIIGALGYVFYTKWQAAQQTEQTTSQTTTPSAAEVPEVKTTDDLTKAEQMLDETDVDGTDDTKQLDADLATF